ncbi:hypothetical protein B0H13DRAFT_1854967 [Mycena leptocephala]|nr:hypothetical protein B0H13DRAFT_1854967 [Mycena leptocephala]
MRRARSVEAMRSQPRPRGPASRGATGTPRSSLGQMAHGETGIPAGGRSLMSKRVDLPDAQLKKRADHGADFLRAAKVTPDLICKFVQLDLASREDLKAIASLIMDWRPDAQLVIGLTPRRGHRQKQQNTAMTRHIRPPTRRVGVHSPSPILRFRRLA